jgi:cell division septal protein FtsQ
MKRSAKILSTLFFTALLVLIFYVSFSVDYEQPYKISLIEIKGCEHLSTEKYFSYAGLDKKDNYDELTLPIIKSRLEKHPYVKRADVLYAGKGKVEVTLYEKDFWALLLTKDNEYIITSDFELLPVLKFTQRIYVPVISNSRLEGKVREFSYVKNNKKLISAFKLLEAAKMINPQLYDNLSEIAYKGNDDFDVYFTFADYSLLIDRENAIEKLYYFNTLWKYINNASINDKIQYIDLRYSGKIFLGLEENGNEGRQS